MKIVYIYYAIARIGGIERVLTEKINYLADIYGYDVYLITSIQGNHPFSFPISSKVKHIDLNIKIHSQYKYRYPLRLYKKWELNRTLQKRLNSEIQIISPDIIIGMTNWEGAMISQLKTPAKKIIESHLAHSFIGIYDDIYRNKIINWFYLYTLRRQLKVIENKCDALVVLTKRDAQEWQSAKYIKVIPNITTLHISEEKNTIKKKAVISVGRLSYQKGFDRLVDAWKLVNQKHADWKLNIYGDNGILKSKIEVQIQNLNLSNEIILHNPTDNIISKYQENEFYVMSSRYEGWGLVLVEAMSCGIPCIAFDCPYGPSDIIENGKNGILVENGDIQGMADAICWMIEHEEERMQMGIAARETSKKYRPEVIMKQWDELFKELINQ